MSFDQHSYKCEFISNNEAEIAPKKCVIEESVVVTTLSWEYVVATSVSLFQRQILETLSLDMTNVRFSRKCLCNVTFSNNTFFRRDLWISILQRHIISQIPGISADERRQWTAKERSIARRGRYHVRSKRPKKVVRINQGLANLQGWRSFREDIEVGTETSCGWNHWNCKYSSQIFVFVF